MEKEVVHGMQHQQRTDQSDGKPKQDFAQLVTSKNDPGRPQRSGH